MTELIVSYNDSASAWEKALYAFLGEKQRRSGSLRTAESYSRMLQHFFGRLGEPPDQVTSQEVFVGSVRSQGADGPQGVFPRSRPGLLKLLRRPRSTPATAPGRLGASLTTARAGRE